MKRTPLKRKTPLTAKTRIRKVSAKKRAYRASAEGQEAMAYMAAVKQLPCCICGAHGPSDAHHVIHGRYGSRKSSDFDVIPLCRSCHLDGPHAIHRGKETWEKLHGPDYSYIEAAREAVKLHP